MTEQPFSLVALRHLSGLTQLQVAERMGVTKGRVGQIERDYPNTGFLRVQEYVKALGGRVEFAAVSGVDVWSDEVAPHPDGPRDRGDRTKVRAKNPRSKSSDMEALVTP